MLRDEGLISRDQFDSAISAMRRLGGRIEEALLDIRAIDEPELLRFLAGKYKTRFVSTEKLSQLEVTQAIIERVPLRVAERIGVVPILFDEAGGILSVVTADPDDPEIARQVQTISGAREVRMYLARPAAIRAGVARWYKKEAHAFATLTTAIDGGSGLFSRGLIDLEKAPPLDAAPTPPSPPPPARSFEAPAIEAPAAARAPIPLPSLSVPTPRPPPPPPPSAIRALASPVPPDPGVVKAGVQQDDLLETMNVLLSLLEANRGELRGHSAMVARLSRQTAERMDLPPTDVSLVTMAAYLHDLGKMGGFHLTALNVSEYEGHRLAAQKSFSTPVRLFEGVRALDAAFAPVTSMYERFDGAGFPGRLKGKDIPLGGRILAICDTYADLTANARNPFRRVLEPAEAYAALTQHADTIFDGNLVELFRLAVQGDDLKQKLLADRPVILLVEPDPEDATVLELRLVSNGFEVHLARAADVALELVKKGEVDFVISEVELKPFDGFELLCRMHADERTRAIPFLFVARRFDTADVNRGFELGAAEYFPKPAAPDVIAAKLRRLAEQKKSAEPTQRRGGVSGSLAELALPDLVQLLAQGRKTGKLSIDSPAGKGEVQFAEGTIADAVFGKLRGEDAFYELLSVMEGDFSLDPSFTPTRRVIQGSAEGLLLEGLRRMDEKNR